MFSPDSPGRATLRAQLLAVFARLASLHECRDDEPLRVTFARGEAAETTFHFPPESLAPYLPVPTDPLADLHDEERAILGKLGDEPMIAKELAARLRTPYDGNLRRWLRPEGKLRQRGLIDHVEGEGYRLTELGARLKPRV